MTEAGEEYMRLWVELDDLDRAGKGNSAAADGVSDRMAEAWRRTTAADTPELARRCAAYRHALGEM